jgi:hypothetical protein
MNAFMNMEIPAYIFCIHEYGNSCSDSFNIHFDSSCQIVIVISPRIQTIYGFTILKYMSLCWESTLKLWWGDFHDQRYVLFWNLLSNIISVAGWMVNLFLEIPLFLETGVLLYLLDNFFCYCFLIVKTIYGS